LRDALAELYDPSATLVSAAGVPELDVERGLFGGLHRSLPESGANAILRGERLDGFDGVELSVGVTASAHAGVLA
jgi:hypothetical protein